MRYVLVAIIIALFPYGPLIVKLEVNRMGSIRLADLKGTVVYVFKALTEPVQSYRALCGIPRAGYM